LSAKHENITSPDEPNIECISLDILNKQTKIQILLFYRPPERNPALMKAITKYIENNCCKSHTTLIIGDLNCCDIDWVNLNDSLDNKQALFLNTVTNLGFHQFVTSPTRGDSILDLILSNDPLLISNVNVREPFSTSDHCSIDFILNFVLNHDVNGRKTSNQGHRKK